MRGSIIRRGKTWLLKFEGPRINGKRDQRYHTTKGSRQAAQKELTRLLAEADTNKLPEATRDTVAAYLRTYLDSLTNVSPRTRERYQELAELQIIPHLGGVKIRYLTSVEIEAWHGKLIRSGLSQRTVVHAHRVLAKALRRVKNTAALEVKLPTIESAEIEILSGADIDEIRTKLAGHALAPIFETAIATGMRRGELLGLQWSDIDLDRGVLRIERSVEETRAGLRLKCPKTRRGRRGIRLGEGAVAMLRAHRVQQMELRLAIGAGAIKPDTLVFSTIEGELLRPRNITKAWSRVVPDKPFHCLRHTHASMLINAGIDVLTISRRLGHSKAATTLDVYGHLIGGADEAAAAAIEGALK